MGILWLMTIGVGVALTAQDADDPQQTAIRRHVRAIESSAEKTADVLLAEFDREHFSAAYLGRVPVEERRRLLNDIRAAATDVSDVNVVPRDEGVAVILGALGRRSPATPSSRPSR